MTETYSYDAGKIYTVRQKTRRRIPPKPGVGPLTSVFPCSESKILDHIVTMKGFDYSISDIARISKVNFKTTLGIIHRLEEQEVIKRTRTVGKAIMYQINPKSSQAKSTSNLAFVIAKKRITQST